MLGSRNLNLEAARCDCYRWWRTNL